MNRRLSLSLAGLLLAALPVLPLAGCADKGGSGRAQPSLPDVDIAKLSEGTTVDYADFTGRTSAVKSVNIKARATGYLEEVLFKDGEMVKKGQPLYRIDPRTYRAELNKYESDIKAFQAQFEQYSADLARARRMRIGEAISREEFDKTLSNKDAAAAQMAAAKAAAQRAKLNLDFTEVRAPIAGKISKTLITEGNLITQDQTLLTTIVSTDPIYADFDVDEQTVLRIVQMIREEVSDEGAKLAEELLRANKVPDAAVKAAMSKIRGRLTSAARDELRKTLEDKLDVKGRAALFEILDRNPRFKSYRERTVPVWLETQIETGFPHRGKIDFVDNQIDPGTGTLRVRGVFDNERETLQPGLFVRLRLRLGDPYQAILVSERALGSDQGQRFLFVVNDNSEVELRPVTVGPLRDNMRVILSGVKPGEWVIVEGLQRVRPRAKVNATKVPMPTGTAPAAPPAEKSKGQNKAGEK